MGNLIVRISAHAENFELFRETGVVKFTVGTTNNQVIIYDHRDKVNHFVRMWQEYGDHCWLQFGFNALEKVENELNKHAALQVIDQYGRRNIHLYDTVEAPNACLVIHDPEIISDRYSLSEKRSNPLYEWVNSDHPWVTITTSTRRVEMVYRPDSIYASKDSFKVCASDTYTCITL
jgi:hypothetical protein